MKYNTKRELEAFFGIHQSNETNSLSVTRDNEGMGRLRYEDFFRGEENCFEQLQITTSAQTRPKFIFAAPWLARVLLDNDPLNFVGFYFFIRSLMDEYDFYVWNGASDNSLIHPLTSYDEFLSKIKNIPLQNKESIREQLAAEGIAVNEYCLLDDIGTIDAYEIFFNVENPFIWYPGSNPRTPSCSLSRCWISFLNSELHIPLSVHSSDKKANQFIQTYQIPLEHITCLDFRTIGSERNAFNLGQLGNLTNVILRVDHDKWIEPCLAELDRLTRLEKIDLQISGYGRKAQLPLSLQIPLTKSSKENNIRIDVDFLDVTFNFDERKTNLTKLTKLKLDFPNSRERGKTSITDWRAASVIFSRLSELHLLNTGLSNEIISRISPSNNLSVLKIHEDHSCITNLGNLSTLRFLKIFEINVVFISDLGLKDLIALEELTVSTSEINQKIKTGLEGFRCPTLRMFSISLDSLKRNESEIRINLDHFPHLKELSLLTGTKERSAFVISSAGARSLSHLKIVNGFFLKGIIRYAVSLFPHLESLSLSGLFDCNVDGDHEPNLSACPNLRELSLNYCCGGNEDPSTNVLALNLNGLVHLHTLFLKGRAEHNRIKVTGLDECLNLQNVELDNVELGKSDEESTQFFEKLRLLPCLHELRIFNVRLPEKIIFNSYLAHVWFYRCTYSPYDIHLPLQLKSYIERYCYPSSSDRDTPFFPPSEHPFEIKYVDGHKPVVPRVDNDNYNTYVALRRRHDPSFCENTNIGDVVVKGDIPLRVGLYCNEKEVDLDKLRMFVFDNVIFDGTHLQFTNAHKEKEHYVLPIVFEKKETDYQGWIEGEFEKGESYPLSVIHPLKRGDLYHLIVEPRVDFLLFYNPSTQCYSIKFESNFKGSVFYFVRENQYYETVCHPDLLSKKTSVVLNQEMSEKLQQCINETDALHFLKNELLTRHQKFNALILYFKNFKSRKLETIFNNTLDVVVACIKEQAGACETRSQAFFILASYLGFKVNWVCNGPHAYIEIAELIDSSILHRIDLGGDGDFVFEKKYKIPVVPKAKNTVQEEKPSEPSSSFSIPASEFKDHEASSDFLKETKQEWGSDTLVDLQKLNSYSTLFQPLTNCAETLEDLSYLFQNWPELPPVLHLLSRISSKEANATLLKYCITHGIIPDSEKYFYIDTPDDFKRLFRTFKINSQCNIENVDGPLKKAVLSKSPIVITVNWSSFTETELASYKSCLDEIANLFGCSFSQTVRVIGFTHTEIRCPSFVTRTKSYQTTPKLFDSDETYLIEPDKKTVDSALEVDIAGRRDWKKIILGDYKLKGHSIAFEKGILFKAMEQQKSLKILNPPTEYDDPEFHRFIYELKVERRCLYQGELVPINIPILTSVEGAPDFDRELQIKFLDEKELSERHPYYLSIHTVDKCYETLSANSRNQSVVSLPGWIESFNSDHDVFFLTGHISIEFFRGIVNEIHRFPKKMFQFYLSPGSSIGDWKVKPSQPSARTRITSESELRAAAKTYSFFLSNDPDAFVEDLLTSVFQGKKVVVIDVTPQTTLSDLLSRLKLKINDGFVIAEYSISALLNALLQNKTVILNGVLSSTLYNALFPLLKFQDEIFDNGKFVHTKGRLISVMPNLAPVDWDLDSYAIREYGLTSYAKRLHITKQDSGFKKLALFYHYAREMPHRGPGLPRKFELNSYRISQSLNLLKQPPSRHRHNPIKGWALYDYPKYSIEYAYLNVLAKFVFSKHDEKPGCNLEKYLELNATLTDSQSHKNVWFLLNCFNGAALKKMFPDLIKEMETSDDFPYIKIDKKRLVQYALQLAEKRNVSLHQQKQMQQLYELLSSEKPFIFLKGDPGVGKTYSVRCALDARYKLYDGFDHIEMWLKHSDLTQQPVLLLDEANMEKPGTWDFLKAFANPNRKEVIFRGKVYPINRDIKFKVIFTGNHETYQKRYYHRFLQNYSEIVYFKKPSEVELDLFLKNKWKENVFLTETHRQLLIRVCKIVDEYVPQSQKTSIRDLENLAARCLFLAKDQSEYDVLNSVYKACLIEFEWAIPKTSSRKAFVRALSSLFFGGVIPHAEKIETECGWINKTIYVPTSRIHFVEAIRQDLKMREQATQEMLSTNKNVFFKSIVVEGDAGIGKSRLPEEILLEQGYLPESDPNSVIGRRYYKLSVTPGSELFYKKLKQAYKEGAIVILDELNLDEQVELLLNQFLCQRPQEGRPGFMILASQNPSHFAGRRGLSPALRDRLHVMHMPNYTHDELLEIAEKNKMTEPDQFVAAYENVRGPTAGLRTFYTALRVAKRREMPMEPTSSFDERSGPQLRWGLRA